MPWTDEMVEDLKKMWDQGLSTGEIGKRLGVSKNSVVGKVHRLQLIGRPSPIKKKDETSAPKKTTKPAPAVNEKKPQKPAVKTSSAPTQKPVDKPQQTLKPQYSAKPQPTPKAEVTPTPTVKENTPKSFKEKEFENYMNVSIPVMSAPKKPGDKISVTDLDNHTCRWPIGDPKDENFHFCGAPVRIGQTYCEEHAAIAYVKNIKK